MGTRMTHYVVWGIKVPYIDIERDNEAESDALEDLMDDYHKGKGGIYVISDAMGGKWSVIGHVEARADDYGGLPFLKLPDKFEDFDVAAGINTALDNFGIQRPLDDDQPRWMVFTHCH